MVFFGQVVKQKCYISDVLLGTGVLGQLAVLTSCQVVVYWSACWADIMPGTGVLVSLLGRHHARYWCGQLARQTSCQVLVWSACWADIMPGTGVLVSLLGRHHARYWCGQLARQTSCQVVVYWSACWADIMPGTGVVSLRGRHHAR